MRENIKQLFERKIDMARECLKVAYMNKERAIAEEDQKIAAAKARVDLLEDLAELDWDTYAEIHTVDRK